MHCRLMISLCSLVWTGAETCEPVTPRRVQNRQTPLVCPASSISALVVGWARSPLLVGKDGRGSDVLDRVLMVCNTNLYVQPHPSGLTLNVLSAVAVCVVN
jgi:hypothetical protein